jgi:diadenosine tetraphosphatase ApaH/serine/threonine PP2A family protein phosphatase
MSSSYLEPNVTIKMGKVAGRIFLNPGSVGQPRDGDPRASYLRMDLKTGTSSVRRIDYPIAEAQREIREAGLPDTLATRLAQGR